MVTSGADSPDSNTALHLESVGREVGGNHWVVAPEESVKFMSPALQIVMANPSEALSRSTTDPLLVMVIPSTM